MNWSIRYAIAQINWTGSPTLESGEAYGNIIGRVNEFYSKGGTVEIHHFNGKKFTPNKNIAKELDSQSNRIENSQERSNSSLKSMLDLYSGAYKKGKFSSFLDETFKLGAKHYALIARDKNNNVTAALNVSKFPGTEDSVPVLGIGSVASISPGHASVLQHAMLHHIAGEQSAISSQVFNPTVNNGIWTEADQNQQNNALRYHKGIGRRIEQTPGGNVKSNWFKSDTTRLVRNTRARTNIIHFYN
jgi:hypothetical protein